MPSLDFPIYATIALGAGPVLFARAFRDFRTRRLIENTPTARIRSMAMGLVEVNGEVVQRSEHMAPFSGRPCAYWQVEIATRTRQKGWSTVHRASSGSPFFLRDDSGLALVYPKDADCRVMHPVEEVCSGIALPDCYANYMSEHQLMFRHVWRLSTLRFRERLLEEGQRVYVLGTAMPRGQALDVSQDALEDAGGDGPHERHIRALQQEAAGSIRRGDHERVFIISQQSERELTLGLGIKAWAELIGGPVLTVAGLGYWLATLASRGHISG